MLRTVFAASMISLFAAGAAFAGQGGGGGGGEGRGANFIAGPVQLAHTDEVQVGIVNVCPVDVSYSVALKNIADATDAATSAGTVPANRGIIVTLAGPTDTDIGALIVVNSGCVKMRNATTMVSAYLADATTHVPRLQVSVAGSAR